MFLEEECLEKVTEFFNQLHIQTTAYSFLKKKADRRIRSGTFLFIAIVKWMVLR